jgi:hypothetical protein
LGSPGVQLLVYIIDGACDLSLCIVDGAYEIRHFTDSDKCEISTKKSDNNYQRDKRQLEPLANR